MRVALLPREVAAQVITSGIARGAWAANAANLALTIPLLVEHLTERGLAASLPLPLAILTVMFASAVIAAFFPRPTVVAVFLLLGAAGAITYQLSLIAVQPDIAATDPFLLNRPAVSLVLVGVGASTSLTGLAWTFVGFLVSAGVSFAVAGVTQSPVNPGRGPHLMLLIYVVAYLVLAAIQSSQRRRMPNLEQLEEETRRLTMEENLRERTTAVVHDTLLNDLSIVMNAPDHPDRRVLDRLRADVATLTSAQWLTESADVAVLDEQDGELRNRIMLVVSDLQWRGLTVRITGSGSGIYRLDPGVAAALVDAIRACLENVLKHSGSLIAEVDFAYSDHEITVIVSDQGDGFDAAGVAGDRLGLRLSIGARIRSVGGTVRVWSTPGTGTSVVISVPVLEKVTAHEESRHGDS